MKRTSYLAELECRLCIALNCKNYPTYENSSTFNLMYEYIEQFFDKADVIGDLVPYLKLLNTEEAQCLREKVR
jgi:N-acetyltransferase B complex (NatB) non catalytic subunit